MRCTRKPSFALIESVGMYSNIGSRSRISLTILSKDFSFLSGRMSHLLRIRMRPFPAWRMLWTMRKSCSESPRVASMTRRDRSERRMLSSERMLLKISTSSSTFAFFRRPAVSVTTNVSPSETNVQSIESRVVPGMSETTTRSSPSRRFSRVDFPAFGRPRIAKRIGRLASPASFPLSGRMAMISSRSERQA